MTRTSDLCSEDALAAATARAGEDARAGCAEVERLKHAYPFDPRLHFLSGSLAAGERNYDEARRAMAEAIAIALDFAIARFQLGLLLLTSGREAEARTT